MLLTVIALLRFVNYTYFGILILRCFCLWEIGIVQLLASSNFLSRFLVVEFILVEMS